MNNNRYTLFCYAICLLISHSLAYSCASSASRLSTTLKFIKKPSYQEALLIIGDTLADVDDNAIIARAHFPMLSPLNYSIEIDDHFYIDQDPEALMQQILRRHPKIENLMPMIRQFFKEFSSLEQIENGIRWQKAKKNIITIGESARPSATFNTRIKAAFEEVEPELDSVLAYENEGFPEPPATHVVSRQAEKFPFLGGPKEDLATDERQEPTQP
jgi:hypothetical protein